MSATERKMHHILAVSLVFLLLVQLVPVSLLSVDDKMCVASDAEANQTPKLRSLVVKAQQPNAVKPELMGDVEIDFFMNFSVLCTQPGGGRFWRKIELTRFGDGTNITPKRYVELVLGRRLDPNSSGLWPPWWINTQEMLPEMVEPNMPIRVTLAPKESGRRIRQATINVSSVVWGNKSNPPVDASGNALGENRFQCTLSANKTWAVGQINNNLYYPQGTIVRFYLFVDTISPAGVQKNFTRYFYFYMMKGAWSYGPNTHYGNPEEHFGLRERPDGSFHFDDPDIFRNNVNVTWWRGTNRSSNPFEPPRLGDPVTVEIRALPPLAPNMTKPKMQALLYYQVYDYVNKKWLPEEGWAGGYFQPMYTHVQTFRIPGYPPHFKVRFYVIAWEANAFPYVHPIGGEKSSMFSYTVSTGGIFDTSVGGFDYYLLLSTGPPPYEDIITNQTRTKVQPQTKINITVVSQFSDITLAQAACYYSVYSTLDNRRLGDGKGPFNRTSATSLYFELPGMPVGTMVEFYVEVWDRNATVLRSRTYSYEIDFPPPPDPKHYSFFFVRVFDGEEYAAHVLVQINNASYSNNGTPVVPAINIITRTGPMGFAYPNRTESSDPLYILFGVQVTVNVTYRNFTLRFNYILDNSTNWKKIFYSSEHGYAVVSVEGRNINVYFNPLEKPVIPPEYAKVRQFGGLDDWYVYVAIIATVIMLAPTYLYLSKRRARAKEEEERITL